MELLGLLEESLEYAGKCVGSVHAGDFDSTTPCTAWTVRQLVNHLVGGTHELTRLAAGEQVDPAAFSPDLLANTDRVGDDPGGVFARMADHALTVWSRPGTPSRLVDFPAAGTPVSVIAHLQLMELLVHGWDVGRAVGQPAEMAPGTAAAALEWARQFFDGQSRGSFFAPPVVLTAPGSPTDELVAFLGRTP
jgi:uncharacterized protein (TIGR03086 family)